jgi:3'-phosphoadenosine 5'-phosphosulfate sulfotransferase (PAPS reductase)/FAD synthetase
MTHPGLVWGPYSPDKFAHIYLGLSGGKDSTAIACRLTRDGIPFTAVYLDTGWDKPDRETGENEVLRYVRSVSDRLGFPLEVVAPREGRDMAGLIRRGRGAPRIGQAKWCTQELKVRPKERFLRLRHGKDQTGVADLVGIRWAESRKRASFDYCDETKSGRVIVRPILHWSVEDVLREHHAAGIEVNPLYQTPVAASRVGCWPCVMAKKSEIRAMAEVDPQRIEEIEELEHHMATATDRAVKPTFFSLDHKFTPIREVVAWSKTSRGGRSLTMFREETGCMSWGLCDAPAPEEDR